MSDSLLSHRHPHDHRHCTPRRQLVSIRKASGDDPEYVVNLDERHPVVVGTIRDVEDESMALRGRRQRSLSQAVVEERRRPQQDIGLFQAPPPPRRPVVRFPPPTINPRPQQGQVAFSSRPLNPVYGERRQDGGLPQDAAPGFPQMALCRRHRPENGPPANRPYSTELSEEYPPASSMRPDGFY